MSLTWKERRSLLEIEEALTREDPQFVDRIRAINRIEEGGDAAAGRSAAGQDRVARWMQRHYLIVLLIGLSLVVLLVLADRKSVV